MGFKAFCEPYKTVYEVVFSQHELKANQYIHELTTPSNVSFNELETKSLVVDITQYIHPFVPVKRVQTIFYNVMWQTILLSQVKNRC